MVLPGDVPSPISLVLRISGHWHKPTNQSPIVCVCVCVCVCVGGADETPPLFPKGLLPSLFQGTWRMRQECLEAVKAKGKSRRAAARHLKVSQPHPPFRASSKTAEGACPLWNPAPPAPVWAPHRPQGTGPPVTCPQPSSPSKTCFLLSLLQSWGEGYRRVCRKGFRPLPLPFGKFPAPPSPVQLQRREKAGGCF